MSTESAHFASELDKMIETMRADLEFFTQQANRKIRTLVDARDIILEPFRQEAIPSTPGRKAVAIAPPKPAVYPKPVEQEPPKAARPENRVKTPHEQLNEIIDRKIAAMDATAPLPIGGPLMPLEATQAPQPDNETPKPIPSYRTQYSQVRGFVGRYPGLGIAALKDRYGPEIETIVRRMKASEAIVERDGGLWLKSDWNRKPATLPPLPPMAPLPPMPKAMQSPLNCGGDFGNGTKE